MNLFSGLLAGTGLWISIWNSSPGQVNEDLYNTSTLDKIPIQYTIPWTSPGPRDILLYSSIKLQATSTNQLNKHPETASRRTNNRTMASTNPHIAEIKGKSYHVYPWMRKKRSRLRPFKSCPDMTWHIIIALASELQSQISTATIPPHSLSLGADLHCRLDKYRSNPLLLSRAGAASSLSSRRELDSCGTGLWNACMRLRSIIPKSESGLLNRGLFVYLFGFWFGLCLVWCHLFIYSFIIPGYSE